MSIRLWTFIALAAVTLSAHAQLRLPVSPLPAVTGQLGLQGATQTTGSAELRSLDRLSKARLATIDHLIRSNRAVIEADPRGEPIVRGEIAALSPTEDVLARARAAGYSVSRRVTLAAADLRLYILTVPVGTSTEHALDDLRKADPYGSYDFNHIYTHSGTSPVTAEVAPVHVTPLVTEGVESTEHPVVRVGLLDSGLDASHPAFRSSVIHTWGCANKLVPDAHGTAVAALLLTRGSAALYAADVYCASPTGGAIDTLVAALDWLTSERVPVVNISLVGPKNLMLERVIATLIERGYLIVAAVGNDGPTAPPLYPAAYPNVVGVTGVDAHRHVLLEALHGPQVLFAAPGADIKAPDLQHSMSEVRGTSFAAPVVAGLLAELVLTPNKDAAQQAVAILAERAVDLGVRGRDLTYGYGFVAPAGR